MGNQEINEKKQFRQFPQCFPRKSILLVSLNNTDLPISLPRNFQIICCIFVLCNVYSLFNPLSLKSHFSAFENTYHIFIWLSKLCLPFKSCFVVLWGKKLNPVLNKYLNCMNFFFYVYIIWNYVTRVVTSEKLEQLAIFFFSYHGYRPTALLVLRFN